MHARLLICNVRVGSERVEGGVGVCVCARHTHTHTPDMRVSSTHKHGIIELSVPMPYAQPPPDEGGQPARQQQQHKPLYRVCGQQRPIPKTHTHSQPTDTDDDNNDT